MAVKEIAKIKRYVTVDSITDFELGEKPNELCIIPAGRYQFDLDKLETTKKLFITDSKDIKIEYANLDLQFMTSLSGLPVKISNKIPINVNPYNPIMKSYGNFTGYGDYLNKSTLSPFSFDFTSTVENYESFYTDIIGEKPDLKELGFDFEKWKSFLTGNRNIVFDYETPGTLLKYLVKNIKPIMMDVTYWQTSDSVNDSVSKLMRCDRFIEPAFTIKPDEVKLQIYMNSFDEIKQSFNSEIKIGYTSSSTVRIVSAPDGGFTVSRVKIYM